MWTLWKKAVTSNLDNDLFNTEAHQLKEQREKNDSALH